MRFLRNTEGKFKRERIRNKQTKQKKLKINTLESKLTNSSIR
jgi:hypothetical protein